MEQTEKEIRTAVVDDDRSMTDILEAYLRSFSRESGNLFLPDIFHDAEAFLAAFAPAAKSVSAFAGNVRLRDAYRTSPSRNSS